MTWLSKALQSIRDLTVIVLSVIGVIAAVRWMTRGKWPAIQQDGPVVAPPVDATDLPSGKELDEYLEKKSKSVMMKSIIGLALMCSLLSSTTSISAATRPIDITNASIMGMYEYSQILEGRSVDRVTNILHIEDGLYKLYFDMGVRVYSSGNIRHIGRVIPIRLQSQVSSSIPWGWVIAGTVLGGLLGYGIAK